MQDILVNSCFKGKHANIQYCKNTKVEINVFPIPLRASRVCLDTLPIHIRVTKICTHINFQCIIGESTIYYKENVLLYFHIRTR